MAVSGGAGGGSLRLMSCVRETSPPDVVDAEETRHEPKKRRFHPLRGLRRMFRRKARTPEVERETLGNSDAQSLEARSQSASQLLDDNNRRRSGGNLQSSGLSVSHDSIFSPEQQLADSGSELESTSSLSIQRLILAQSGIRAELVDAVRRRRGREDEPSDEEEDLGLPRSPCSNSPTTADVLFEKVLKESTNKSSHSTCSDGSLLSMGSSEMDEDSYGQSSRHSSKLSLQDKRNLVSSDLSPTHGLHITHGATQLELGVDEATPTPLSHSAARHKMAVKPKRTHGAPRRRRLHQIGGGSLPVTPEVNEDGSHSGRSVTPDVETNNVSAQPDDADAVATPACSSNTNLPTATQLKSASLPPGLAPVLSNWNDSSSPVKLSRSRSSATNRQLDPNPSSIIENDESTEIQQNKKEDMSFFGRLLSRRSGKKKKSVDDKESSITTTAPPLELPQKRMDEKGRYVHEVTKLSRNHPAARQRVEPINIPSECPTAVTRMHVSYSAPTPPLSPELKNVEKDDLTIIKQPSNKVLSFNKDDLMYEKKTLVTKSFSFRSNKGSEENMQFASLDTDALVSLPVNLQTSNVVKKSGKLVEDEANQKDDLELQEETVGQEEGSESNVCSVLDINNDKNIGVLNKSLVQDFASSSSNVITETKDYSSVTSLDKKESFRSGGVCIKSSLSASCNDVKEFVNSKHDNNEVFIKSSSNSSLTNVDQNNVVIENCEITSRKSSESVESISHQVTTIPIGTSIVNIINNNCLNDEQKSDDFDDFSEDDNLESSTSVVDKINSTNVQISSENKDISLTTSHMTVISSESNDIFIVKSENSKVKTPEPKSRTQNQILSDESQSSTVSTTSFVPVPAPRLSKRESLPKLSPPNVPEFLKVQLNHIDNKPQTTNVVLSKLLSDSDNGVAIQENLTSKSNDVIHDECDNFNECDMKSSEEVEIKQDQIIASSTVKSQVPVITAVTDKVNESVAKLNESKQKSSLQTLQHQQPQPVPNPRYSIVSITANGNSSENASLKYKPDNQIIRKKSIVKESNGCVKEKLYSSSEKSSVISDNKNELENSSTKHILRKKSFNKDGIYSDKTIAAVNTTSLLRNSSENATEVPKVVDEIIPKVVLRQKPLVNDVIIVETQQKNRKSSLETFQQVSTKNSNIGDKNSSNDVSSKYTNGENVKEKYRNSFGSCDTLLSQDSSTSLDVVYRRKSLTSREVITKQKDKDDEPELLKVFARRSLKIKDTDINLQNNDLDVISTNASSTNSTKSRDSDKENDCGDSPPEERKKIKDTFIDSKTENTPDNTGQVFNVKTNSLRTQRSFSVNTEDVNTNVNVLSSIHKENNQNSYEKRQRSRTFPDNQKIIEPPNVINALNQPQKPSINNIFVEKEVEVISKQEVVLNNASENSKEENDVPLFKRIQQRKEEWEKRAQLAMKRTHP